MTNWPKKIIGVLPKLARLLVFMAVVYGVAMAVAVRQARAEVEEIMLGLGAEMMHHPGAQESRLRQLRLNGAPIQMRTGNVSSSLDEVLEFFEGRCQARDGRFAEQMVELTELTDQIPELADGADQFDGTMVMNTGARGYVACLDMGEEREDHNGVIRRIQSFLNSGNLSDVGHMRYLYAERVDDEQTFFMTMFSDADLNLFEMFPSEGDAPGIDPITRPDGSRRILSSFEENEPYGVTIFAAEGDQEDGMATHFEQTLPTEGWSAVERHEGQRVRMDGVIVMTYSQDERMITIAIQENEGLTLATVMSSDEDTSL